MNKVLNLSGIACPMNFVRTKLALDKLESGEALEVWLDAGEPVDNVSSSVLAEGHTISEKRIVSDHLYSLTIRKA